MSKVYNLVIFDGGGERPMDNIKCLARDINEAKRIRYETYIENNLCDPHAITAEVAILGFKL